MSLSALDSVGDAFEATKRFLWPFERVLWARLAVVMLFVSAGGFSFTFPFTPGDPGTDPGTGQPDPVLQPELTTTLLVFIVAFVAFVIAVGLLWGLLSATMEFVFVESLSRESVRLRAYAKRFWRRGLRLFGFRIVVWLLTFGGIVVSLLALGVLIGGWPPGGWNDAALIAVILLAIPLFLGAIVVVGLVLGFTTMFVVPVMLTEDRGVISAWRRFWPTLTGNWKEYLVYLVLSVVLGWGVGIVASLVMLAVLVVVGIPAIVVAIPGIVLFVAGIEAIAAAWILVVALVAGLLVFVANLVVQVPLQTFLRYYALLVLGDTESDFDVVPDARAAVRADGGEDEADEGDAEEDSDEEDATEESEDEGGDSDGDADVDTEDGGEGDHDDDGDDTEDN